jgi:hypothetical protein
LPIYVYMRKRSARQGLTTEDELAGPYWSLWRQRRFPYGDLEVGDQVLLLDHWRDEDRFSWQLAVAEVEHRHVESKAEAIDHIATMFGLPEDDVADDPYLGAKDEGAGFLIAWRGDGIRRLNLPRPAGFKLSRHGWGRYPEPEMDTYLEQAAALVTPVPPEALPAPPRRNHSRAALRPVPAPRDAP